MVVPVTVVLMLHAAYTMRRSLMASPQLRVVIINDTNSTNRSTHIVLIIVLIVLIILVLIIVQQILLLITIIEQSYK